MEAGDANYSNSYLWSSQEHHRHGLITTILPDINHMDFKGLRTCIYKVNDVNTAKAWYSDALGFGPYFDEPFYVGYNVGGFELGLIPDEGNPATHEGGVHTYWGVDNVEATYQRLLDMGASAYESPNEVGGGIVVAMVKDPWGNLFGMIYNPHFSLA